MIISFIPKIKAFVPVIKKIPYTKKQFRDLIKVTEEMHGIMKVDLADGIKTYQKSIDLYQVEQYIAAGQWNELKRIIDWQGFDEGTRRKISKTFEKAILSGGNASLPFFYSAVEKLIPTIRDVALPFSIKNPRIQAWKENRLALLNSRIKDGAIEAIDKVIKLNFELGIAPKQAARVIQRSIGLNWVQANALTRYQNGLEANGIVGSKLDKLVGGYSDRLIKQRSETIAWTEVNNAVNQGQMEVWRQADEAGFVDAQKSVKVWLTMGDDITCDICGGLNGTEAPLDGEFYSDVTGESYDSPNAHVNCRCQMTIEIRE